MLISGKKLLAKLLPSITKWFTSKPDYLTLGDYLYCKEPKQIVKYLVDEYNSIEEDPKYYMINPYKHETGMIGKGVVSNYKQFIRRVSQQLFLLGDTHKQKQLAILKLLPQNLSNEIHEGIESYQSAVLKYMEKTDGLRKYQDKNKWGYLDKNQQVIITPNFEEAYDFSNSMAKVKINGKIGFIDNAGDVIIEPKYDWIANFYEGLAMAKINNKFGYINIKGEELIEFKFDKAKSFNDGVAEVKKSGIWYKIDKVGNELL